MAGGDPNSGSSNTRGDIQAENKQGDLTPEELAQLESLGKAIDELAREIESGQVDPKLLDKLAMTPEQLKGFVEKYTGMFDKLREKLSSQGPPRVVRGQAAQIGQSGVQQGRGRDAGGASGTQGMSADQMKNISDARLQQVPPEYRKQVEAYFRAVAEMRSSTPATQPAK